LEKVVSVIELALMQYYTVFYSH